MTNPLIEKFYELHPEKKEKPKFIKAKNAEVKLEVPPEWLEQNTTSITSVTSNITTPSGATSNTGITKASPIKCFDNPSANDAFLQIAEKIKNGTAQVSSMSIELDAYGNFSYGKRITFEVYDRK
jgi:hypothetical protein